MVNDLNIALNPSFFADENEESCGFETTVVRVRSQLLRAGAPGNAYQKGGRL